MRLLIAVLGVLSGLCGTLGVFALAMRWPPLFGDMADTRETMILFFILAVLCFIAQEPRIQKERANG